ncbi:MULTISPECIES: phage major capsid protein [unclassified Companilactobacillus]|uniref:phage major capsid protein n=1 Tax=unclassified Companilactobacillus TaxID=2767904 RepID=UPI002FF08653
MKNLDLDNEKLKDSRVAMFNALRDGDEKAQEEAFGNFAQSLQDTISADAFKQVKEMNTEMNDEKVLEARGIRRPMTSSERKFFADAAKKQSFENLDEVLPETVIEDVLSRITEEHPLLAAIDTQPVTALMKLIYADPTKKTAFWGKVPDDIKQIVEDGFKPLSLESSKLSGFMAVPKGFFKLGPSYLAQYVITFLEETMSATLETAVVSGDGNLQPIGMTKKLSGSTDGVYPDKPAIKLNDLKPLSLAGIHAALTKAKTANGPISAIVNPMSYWAKLFPQLAVNDADNNWHLIALPTGDTIIQSYAVPEDKIVFGFTKNYILGVSGAVELKEYDQTLAIEDMDLYIAKFFGMGVAKNQNAFFVADISGMEGATIPELEGAPDVKRAGKIDDVSEAADSEESK